MRFPLLCLLTFLSLLLVSCDNTGKTPTGFRAEVLGTIDMTLNVPEDIVAIPFDPALLPDMRCPCEENKACPALPLRCSAQTIDDLILRERFMQATYTLTNLSDQDYQHLLFYAIEGPETIAGTAFSQLKNANDDSVAEAEVERLALATGKRIEGTRIITDEAKDNLREVSERERGEVQKLISNSNYRVLDQAYLATNLDNTFTIIPAKDQGRITFSVTYPYNADVRDPYFITVSFLVVNVQSFE